MSRPRLPEDNPRVTRRREQYRRSKLRSNEARRHAAGRCRRDRGELCPMLDKMAFDESQSPLERVIFGNHAPVRVVVVLPDGSRTTYHKSLLR